VTQQNLGHDVLAARRRVLPATPDREAEDGEDQGDESAVAQGLQTTAPPRNREEEIAKARARAAQRFPQR
jgi:hypothetical protein